MYVHTCIELIYFLGIDIEYTISIIAKKISLIKIMNNSIAVHKNACIYRRL